MRAPRSRRSRASSIATHWHEAYASSGTAFALAEILEQNAWSAAASRPTGSRAAPAHDRAPATSRSSSWTALKAGARAGARRRASRSCRGASRSFASSASIRSAARCGSACSTTCSGARATRQPRRRPSSGSSSATASTASTRGASRRLAGALYLRAAASPDADARATRRMGGLAARGRVLGIAHRLPQARRVHPAERRHAGLLRRRAARHRAPRARLPWRSRQGRRRARRRATCARSPRAAPRGAVPSRARAPIAVPRITLEVGATIRLHVPVGWLKAAPADRASAREGARGVGRGRLSASRRCDDAALARRRSARRPLRPSSASRNAFERSSVDRSSSPKQRVGSARGSISTNSLRRCGAARLALRARAGTRRSAP